jgi:hypothetical protein
MVCSTAIDCATVGLYGVQYSGRLLLHFLNKLLDIERSVTSNTVRTEWKNIGYISVLCLHTGSCDQLSHTVQLSV